MVIHMGDNVPHRIQSGIDMSAKSYSLIALLREQVSYRNFTYLQPVA